jgi:hypothetical protein
MAAAAGCSSGGDDDAAGSGNKTSSGATGGTTGGTGAAGKGGTGASGGTGGGSGTGGASATGGTGGTTGGSSGAAAGGRAGAATGGAPAGGKGGSAGSAAGAAAGGAPAGGMAGSLGSGGAAAGNGGGGMPATLVTPIMRSGTSYVLEFGDTYFEVNPMLGARVTNVHLKGGSNLLGAGMGDNSGSTFWPSPQANWTWPPTDSASITNINDKAYTASNDDTSMTFVGMAASDVGISVTKKFAADLAKEAIVATYTMIGSASGKSAAPWEITRFGQSGVTFFKSGGTPTMVKNMANGMDQPPTMDAAGCTWLTSPGTFVSTSAKDQLLVVNGAGGFLAHADSNWVVVKKFTATPANMIATGEGEIDIYMNNPGNSGNPLPYMEVEEQGPYGAVAQGAGVTWTVTWFVRPLPSGAMATAGNQQLADFVQSLVQ